MFWGIGYVTLKFRRCFMGFTEVTCEIFMFYYSDQSVTMLLSVTFREYALVRTVQGAELLALSKKKNINYLSTILFILFQRIPHLRLYTFAIIMGAFVFPLQTMKYTNCWGTDLQLKSLFLASQVFQICSQIKVAGARSGLYGRWDNCHLKEELISSTVDEAVWKGALSCKRTFSGLAWGATFSNVLRFFFFKITSE